MSDEAESSHTRRAHVDNTSSDTELDEEYDDAREALAREQSAKERRWDAKRKRVEFLDDLLRELDALVFVELVTIYYCDCSFFWFAVRALVHLVLLTPLPDLQLARQHDEHKAFLPLILFGFAVNFLLHAISQAPSAGEETRGYLHGGLMMDFIGQQGPTSKWKLVTLDTCVMILQLVMVSVTVKRRELKKKLGNAASGSSAADEAEAGDNGDGTAHAPANREQDADSEERGLLRRTDTLSDIGAEPSDEDALLASMPSDAGPADAHDVLSSGQGIIGDFSLIDTLIQEHADYQVYRQTRTDTASTGLSPGAMRQLHNIRTTFGVGGG